MEVVVRFKSEIETLYVRARATVQRMFRSDSFDTGGPDSDSSPVEERPMPLRVRPTCYDPIGAPREEPRPPPSQPRQHKLHLRYLEKSRSERIRDAAEMGIEYNEKDDAIRPFK